MAKRRRASGRSSGFVRALLYAFAVIGLLASLLGAYQFRKVSALYSLVDSLSVTDKVDMQLSLDSAKLQLRNLTAREVPTRVRDALLELGIHSTVRAR